MVSHYLRGGMLLLLLVAKTTLSSTPFLPPVFQQQVVPNGATSFSYAGSSVAITPSGRRAVVGASENEEVPGFVAVYDRVGSVWKETAKLQASSSPDLEGLGQAVAISEDGLTIASACDNVTVGATEIFVFEHIGNTWNSRVKLEPEPVGSRYLGSELAISLDGQTIAATTEGSGFGIAVVFIKTGQGSWEQQGPGLTFSGVTNLGDSIALSSNGNLLVVGVSDDSTVYFAKRNSSLTWSQSGSGFSGCYLLGEGLAMSADGTFVVGGGLGCADVFRISAAGDTYDFLQSLIAPGSSVIFGSGIAISPLSDFVIVGDILLYENSPVPDDSSTTYTKGGAFIFKLLSDRASYGLVGNITIPFFNATLTTKSDFGTSVAVSDHYDFLVGADNVDDNTGAAYFFGPGGNCRPAYSTTRIQCIHQNQVCGGKFKWVNKGCKVPGSNKHLGDGGCQCQGYCGYSCRSACTKDHECVWATKSNTCLVKATGQPGGPIIAC